jgi:hypothetical protein
MSMEEEEYPLRLSTEPVTGYYRPPEGYRVEGHSEGWDQALAHALKNIGRERGRYQVHVEFGAVIAVENPGGVVEYQVTLI